MSQETKRSRENQNNQNLSVKKICTNCPCSYELNDGHWRSTRKISARNQLPGQCHKNCPGKGKCITYNDIIGCNQAYPPNTEDKEGK